MALFTRLLVLAFLTCSFNSTAKYNEAICILYKQQMQKYSADKNSQRYRNASRDFDKNCSNPPPKKVMSESVNVQNTVVVKPQKDVSVKPVTVNPLDVSKSTEDVEEIHHPHPAQQSDKNSTSSSPEKTTKAPSILDVQPAPADPVKPLKEPINEPVKTNLTPVIKNNTDEKAAAGVAVTKVAKQPSMSVTSPILAIILVLLIAGLIIYKLRIKKQSNTQTAPQCAAATINDVSGKEPLDETTHNERITHTVSTNNDCDIVKANESAGSEQISPKSESNTAIKAAKNPHDFKEPEVRSYDPKAHLANKLSTESTEHMSNNDTQPIHSASEKTVLQADELTPLVSVHEVKEPTSLNEENGQTPNEDDGLADALAQFNNEIEKEQRNQDAQLPKSKELKEQDSKAANPFANLSLDPTWDPNSKEKPVIEPKKAQPKSERLIAAEQQAKKMQTDE